MVRRKTKRGRKSDGPPRGRRTLAVLRVACWVGVIVALVLALALGSVRAWGAICARPEFRVAPSEISRTSCPSFVRSAAMLKEMKAQLSFEPSGLSIFKRDLAYRVQQELRAVPWVLDVRRVARRLPNKLVLDIIFRKPAGVVEMDGGRYLVCMDGFWLPGELYAPPPEWAKEDTPVIYDQRLHGKPPWGRSWDGPSIKVGARLTQFLREGGLFKRLNLQCIDVSNVGRPDAETQIVLRTETGVVIRWGNADSYKGIKGLRWSPLSRTDSQKLRMLLAKLGDYHGLQGMEYIDLRVNKITWKPRKDESAREP